VSHKKQEHFLNACAAANFSCLEYISFNICMSQLYRVEENELVWVNDILGDTFLLKYGTESNMKIQASYFGGPGSITVHYVWKFW
jgi:hypothetical protein